VKSRRSFFHRICWFSSNKP